MNRKSNSLPRYGYRPRFQVSAYIRSNHLTNCGFNSSQILMPLINQYFKNHCLYFLSTPAKVLGSGGHSSNKEKEMIARFVDKHDTGRRVTVHWPQFNPSTLR